LVTLKTTNGLGGFPVNFVQKTFMKNDQLIKHLQNKSRKGILLNIAKFPCKLCEKMHEKREQLINISKRNTQGSVHFCVNFVKVKREHLIKHL
jgi:hypothetical protein